MITPPDRSESDTSARVIRLSRRYVDIMLKDGSLVRAISESQALGVTVGDQIIYENKQGGYVIKDILERKNCIERSYQKNTKILAANVDLVIIVSAITPLFNRSFIDRVLVETRSQKIDTLLLINKIDLGLDEAQNLIAPYLSIKIACAYASAHSGEGLDNLRAILSDPKLSVVTLVGISGVGKSSILNCFIPEASRPTQNVSLRTGQGRQTTSQSIGYSLARNGLAPLLLIDLPGLSNFGLAHHSKESIRQFFPEFKSRLSKCQYSSCLHIDEPNCEVKQAILENQIEISRYQSYIDIINEIESAKEY